MVIDVCLCTCLCDMTIMIVLTIVICNDSRIVMSQNVAIPHLYKLPPALPYIFKMIDGEPIVVVYTAWS